MTLVLYIDRFGWQEKPRALLLDADTGYEQAMSRFCLYPDSTMSRWNSADVFVRDEHGTERHYYVESSRLHMVDDLERVGCLRLTA